MKLTKRGEVVCGVAFLLSLFVVMGFFGWVEGGMQ